MHVSHAFVFALLAVVAGARADEAFDPKLKTGQTYLEAREIVSVSGNVLTVRIGSRGTTGNFAKVSETWQVAIASAKTYDLHDLEPKSARWKASSLKAGKLWPKSELHIVGKASGAKSLNAIAIYRQQF